METKKTISNHFLDGICIGNERSVVNWLLSLRSLISRLWPAGVLQQGISNHRLVDTVVQQSNLYLCHSADLPFRS